MCGAVTAPVLCLPVCQGPSLKAPRVTCGDPVPEKNRRRLDNVFSSQIEGAPDHRSHSSQAQLGKSVSLSGFPAWSMETQNNWGTVRKSRPPAPSPPPWVIAHTSCRAAVPCVTCRCSLAGESPLEGSCCLCNLEMGPRASTSFPAL